MIKVLFYIPLFVGLLVVPTQSWADFEAGQDAFKRGDYATALKELRPLAETGLAMAQNSLGLMYMVGLGVPEDYAEGSKWFRLAAEQGDALGQTGLAKNYKKGKGVPQDYAEAAKWFRLAAEQGDGFAQYELSVFYKKGQGVPKDYVLAHMWANLAAAQGVKLAIEERNELKGKMTSAQIAKAQALATAWKPKGKVKNGD